jgi:hypothetical protein
MILSSLILASTVVLLPPEDPACKTAGKGWIRAVVRVVDKQLGAEFRTAAPGPKETMVTLSRESDHRYGFTDDGIAGYATLQANGTFSIEVDPRRTPLLSLTIVVQTPVPVLESASITFRPQLFPKGVCVEIFLLKLTD